MIVKMLVPNFTVAVATVFYSLYVYLSFDETMLTIWHVMFFPSISFILQICVIHKSLDLAFPGVLYDTTEYERPFSITITIYVIGGVFLLITAKAFILSLLYVDTIENNVAIVLYQSIMFLLLLCSILWFFIDALRFCSGWAYCDYLRAHNHRDIQYAYLPFTLPEREMGIYLGERFNSRRAHTV